MNAMSVDTSEKLAPGNPTSEEQLDLILSLQRQVLEEVAASVPLLQLLQHICQTLEQALPDSIVAIRQLDASQNQVSLVCTPGITPSERALMGILMPCSSPTACCIVNCNASSAPPCPRTHQQVQLPTPSGFHICTAFPIIADQNRIEGSIVLCSRRMETLDSYHSRLMETAAHLASIAIRRDQIEEALRSTTVRLHQVTNALPGVVFQFRQSMEGQRRFTFLSRQSEQILGLKADVALSCFSYFWQTLPPKDRDLLNQALEQSQQQHTPWQHEFRLQVGNFPARWIQVSALPEAPAPDGSQTWNGIFLDISHSKASAEQLVLAATAFATTSEGILITDPNEQITDVNEAFCAMSGYAREELIGKTPHLLNSNRHPSSFFKRLHRSLAENDHWQGEIWNQHKSGEASLHRLRIRLVRSAQGELTHKVAVYTDINRQHESEQRLRYLSDHDTLTHLPNRQLFNTVLQQWLRHQPQLTVMMLDLDRFKHINESLGHEAGDRLLIKVSELLKRELSPVDMLARLGGDEFAILAPMIDNLQDAEQMAQRLVSTMDRAFEINGKRYFITASVGVALAPQHGNSVDQLAKHADTALHHAKKHGRNAYRLYQPELGEQVETWLKLEPELRNALENQQFVLHYQPQVDGANGKIVGAEALIRWQHPELGMVSPGSFLPIAEEIGLMPHIGQWVLQSACEQLARWLAGGLEGFRLSINLAGQQIMQGGLATQVENLMKQHQLPAHTLELEILETFVMENEAQTASVLLELRSLGIDLALDDFGTGYSSLAYLKKLPIQKVKIDQSLVRDIPNDPNDGAIARAVIALGRSLQLKVCAEGVETDAQHQFLKEAACDQLQGYLFSKPLPAKELETLLQQHKRLR